MALNIIKKLKIYGLKQSLSFAFQELHLLIYYKFLRGSYSQKGEDLEIEKLLKDKNKGFYIDVGANDPIRFSNTHRFYKKGWKGINIEPNPLVFKKISEARNNDINLNMGIAAKKDTMKFYSFFPDTLSTFSEQQAKEYIQQGFTLLKELNIAVDTLENVLDKHAKGIEIDFLSIDTENFDYEVLKSNNWVKYKPKIICIEQNSNEAIKLLEENGYKKVYDNNLNSIYSV